MRKITLAFLFSVMFSSTSFADWRLVSENVDGDTFYVDFERIRKHDGYVYYWELTDYLRPTSEGSLSAKVYTQTDCTLFRVKRLRYYLHKEPMGEGDAQLVTNDDGEWLYPPPDSTGETILQAVCEYAN